MNRFHALPAALLAGMLLIGCGGSTETTQGSATTPDVSLPSVTITPIPTVAVPAITIPEDSSPAAPVEQAPSATTPTNAADEAAVRLVITNYVAAFVAGDGATACGLLTEEVRQTFLDAIGSTDPCPTAFAKVIALQDSSVRESFRSAEVTDVQVAADTASASLSTAPGVSVPVALVREPDGWKIATLPTG